MIERGARWRDNPTENMRLWMREKRKERKRLGLCVECGSRRAEAGHMSCAQCLARKRLSAKAKGNA